LLAIALTVPLPLLAEPPVAAASLGPEELEQIAAPIALYPDALLAQTLMAATYQRARWARWSPGPRPKATRRSARAPRATPTGGTITAS
jgi:hypothetical protein